MANRDNTDWKHVAHFQGSGKKPYKIAVNAKSGIWGCDCPAWKFQRGSKGPCKHIVAVKNALDGAARSSAITFSPETALLFDAEA